MKVSKQTKKKPSTSMTTRERMMKRKEDLAKRSGKGLIFPKTGTLRVRIKNPGDDQEIGIEVIQFYLGQELGGVISPATFDEPCPFMEMYDELKSSKNSKDKALAGKAEVLVSKQRDGRIGTIPMLFNGSACKFIEPTNINREEYVYDGE